MIDVIIAWLVAEDDGAKEKAKRLLADRDETLKTIRITLKGENGPLGKVTKWHGLTAFRAT